MLPFFKGLTTIQKNLTKKAGFRTEPWPIFLLGLAILLVAFIFAPKMVSLAFSLSLFLAPLWLPILIVGAAVSVWLVLKRSEFIAKQTNILLEIKPPRSVIKTPLAMEAFLAGIHQSPGEGTWYLRFIRGSVRPWWSLEIASFEGQVHFYIWTRAIFRRIIEAQLYAQYPGVQIVEAPDYTRLISATPEEWSIWGCDYKHDDPDPIPIKTYIEYGLDKVQKEPEQVDPLANLIEFMGSIGKGEQVWLQFVIRVHKGEKYNKNIFSKDPKTGKLKDTGKAYTWKDEAKKLIDDIRKSTREPYKDPATGKEIPGFPNPTKGQMEKIAAIERNVSKLAFDVGARGIYLANKNPEAFKLNGIFGLANIFKAFNSEGWNKLGAAKWMTQFDDYPWEFSAEKRKNVVRRLLIDAYRRRQFYHEPFSEGLSKDDIMVMSTEEIATVFHVPSQAITTPTLGRIQSATSEAPSNLPV